MYARHYSHRIRGAGAPAAPPHAARTQGALNPERSTDAACPPILRLVPPLEEAPTGAPSPAAGPVTALPVRRVERHPAAEAGMATAEYAIATLAAVGFAGLLVFILRSDEVRGFLLTLIRTALALP
ncbi:DUF4244 domain-containing protein [Pseudarthrobacter sp. NPDC058362]|uniref:DUF4244 domain-containing protein n=1 Tax=Pseudarthrobacter sp. NPDC058362 TaxID=3346458 RepID=UPI003656EA82